MHITRLLSGIIFSAGLAMAQAQELTMIAPFPAGNQSDLIGRAVADAIAEQQKIDRIKVMNMPGAETMIAANYFKNNPKTDLIISTAGMVIFNPALRKDLPYKRQDFQHIAMVGNSVVLWVTRPNTKIKSPEDLISHLPPLVGGFASSLNFNLTSLVKEKGLQSEIVNYRGFSDVINDIVNGSIDLGLVTMSGAVTQWVSEGKLHIVGSSHHRDLVVDGISIPSVSRRLSIPQFDAFVGFAVQPTASVEHREKLRSWIWQALQDPATQESIRRTKLILDISKDSQDIDRRLEQYYQRVAKYNISKQ
jgi:tripartite-type tricarboxylate transporter receptor subunit TctC